MFDMNSIGNALGNTMRSIMDAAISALGGMPEPEYVDDSQLRNQFEQEQQAKTDQGRELTKNLVTSAYTSAGIDPYSNPYYQSDMDAIDKMEKVPGVVGEMQRRFFDGGGSWDLDPANTNLFGFTSQNKTSDAARNIYDHYFGQEDASGYRNVNGISRKLTGTESNEAKAAKAMAAYTSAGINPYSNPYFESDIQALLSSPEKRIVDENAIDDGYSKDSREAAYMTGDQYLKYVNDFGLPGRDARDIDPNEIYSKQDEQDNYGFIPYIVSDEGLSRFHDTASAQKASSAFNTLADLRRANTDFELDYEGEKYSGKDFSKNVRLWNQRLRDSEPETVYDEAQTDEFSIPQALVATDDQGNEYVAPARPTRTVNGDGSIVWSFGGDPADDWYFEDGNDEAEHTAHRPAADGEYVSAWVNQMPLELDSGQKIRADKAADLWQNMDAYADYGPGNWNKPAIEDPFKEGGWAPWFVDMALSSAPYFYLPAAGAKAAADTMNNASGFQPGYQDYLNGTYSLTSDNPTEDQRNAAALASAIMPMTEQLWGPLGNAMLGNPTRALASKIASKSLMEHPLFRVLENASNEGLEEIPGNIVEELQQSGLDWYADSAYYKDENGNPILDANGEPIPMYDSQGRRIVEPTGWPGRVANFGGDAPLSYTGGFALGGLLGLPNVIGYNNEYKKNKSERDIFGFNARTPVDADLATTQGFTDEERAYYNR